MTAFSDLRPRVRTEVAKAIVGHEEAVDLLLVATVAGGHVLMEGPPGVAKTMLSGAIARVLGASFSRVQFTPDTTPIEVTGTTVTRGGEKVFLPGAIFTNVLLADEINRTPPRTQAALLEAMQERHVTVEGTTRWLPRPFVVIATQNPYEQEGVFRLPESQLDRFLFKVGLGYGDVADELRVLSLPHRGLMADTLEEVTPLLDSVALSRMQSELSEALVPEEVARAVVALVRATRSHPGVLLGASPRAAIHLITAAKAYALLAGRERVEPSDVFELAPPVLEHRMIVEHGRPEEVVQAAIEEVRG
jgi:MoxR-like ATPase